MSCSAPPKLLSYYTNKVNIYNNPNFIKLPNYTTCPPPPLYYYPPHPHPHPHPHPYPSLYVSSAGRGKGVAIPTLTNLKHHRPDSAAVLKGTGWQAPSSTDAAASHGARISAAMGRCSY